MTEKPIKFDQKIAFYVGLNKVRDRYIKGAHKINNSSTSTTRNIEGHGSATTSGVEGGGKVSAAASNTTNSEDPTDLTDAAQLRAIAPQILNDIASTASPVDEQVQFEIGRNYSFTGYAQFRLRTHDNFREEGDQETAPRIALWLVELPDTPDDPAEAKSVTWLVLGATANGQLATALGGTIGDWRGGSQTDHLFELLAAKSEGKKRKKRDSRWLEHPWLALAARNMLQDSSRQTVSIVFQCLEIHNCPVSGENSVESYLGWTPASTDREVVVRRLILGTPFFVLLPKLRETPSDSVQSVWQRLRSLFARSES